MFASSNSYDPKSSSSSSFNNHYFNNQRREPFLRTTDDGNFNSSRYNERRGNSPDNQSFFGKAPFTRNSFDHNNFSKRNFRFSNNSHSRNRNGSFNGAGFRDNRFKPPPVIETFKPDVIVPQDAAPVPLDNIAELDSALKQHLLSLKIRSLFPIQSYTFGSALKGKDIIGRAKTGTGKTLAFALPIIQRILTGFGATTEITLQPPGPPVVLVLAPSRELALQITQEFSRLTPCLKQKKGPPLPMFNTISVFGGVSYVPQERALNSGRCHVVVGTPGRLMDLYEKQVLKLADIKTIVIDEADYLLELGFKREIDTLLDAVCEGKTSSPPQLLMFSATIANWVHATAKKRFSASKLFIDAVSSSQDNTLALNSVGKVSDNIKQIAIPIEDDGATIEGEKIEETVAKILKSLITNHKTDRVVVFCNTKSEVDSMGHYFNYNERNIRVGIIHGNLTQARRSRTIADLKAGMISTLIATDVAARGIDVSGVKAVLHLGPPNMEPFADKYVHRAGRTGRAGSSGLSIMIYKKTNNQHRRGIHDIERILGFKFEKHEDFNSVTAANTIN